MSIRPLRTFVLVVWSCLCLIVFAQSDVHAAVLFSDDFNDGNDEGWTVNSGTWAVESGEYSQSNTSASGYSTTLTDQKYSDIEVEFEYEILDYAGNTGNWAGIIFRKTNVSDTYGHSGYMVYMRYSGQVHLYKAGTGNIGSYQTGETQTGTRSLKVVVEGSEIKVYYNGGSTPVISVTDTAYTHGYASLVTGKTHTHFDNVSISSDYSSIEFIAANHNVNVHGTTEFRVLGHTGAVEEDIGESYYELTYDDTKLEVDSANRTIKGLAAGAHEITLAQNGLTHSVTMNVNDFDSSIIVKGEQIVNENFEGTVPGEYLPDGNFTVVTDNGNKVLAVNSYGATRKTGLIQGNYDGSGYMVEADVKLIDGSAATNGGFSIGARTLADNKSYVFRYVDVLKYNATTHKYDAGAAAIWDRIGIARDEGGSFSNWYYGVMKTDAALGILQPSRSFGEYYTMTAVAAGTTVRKLNGTAMYDNLQLRINELNGTLVGEAGATTLETDYEPGGLKMNPLTQGNVYLGAQNALVYMDNIRISKVHVAQGLQLVITDSWIDEGQTSHFEVRALPGGEVIPAGEVNFAYDSNVVTLDAVNNTVTSSTAGEHRITVIAEDMFSGVEKSYTAVLTVRDTTIVEDFENGGVDHPRYFSIPSAGMISDGTNHVYRLENEISRLFGHEDWTNYSVEGEIKIADRMLDASDTNTAFEIVMRRKALQGEFSGQGGHSFVYRIGTVGSDNYMRIGTSAGPGTDIEGSEWTAFKAEVNGDQLIFTLGETKQYYALDAFVNGGFSFRAVNCEVYLDNIIVKKIEGDPPEALIPTSITLDDSSIIATKYDMFDMSEITAVKAHYSGGQTRYITNNAGVTWSIVSGSDKAELLLRDTIRFKPGAMDNDTVTVRATYQGETADIVFTVDVPAGTENDYIKNGTPVRQESTMMKLAYNYGQGTIPEFAGLTYVQSIFGKMMLYPEEKNYDAEVNWLIEKADAEELKGPAISGADFVVTQMLAMYKMLDGKVNVSPGVWNDMISYVQNFHYEEPGAGISENHKIQHYAGAIITGETWPTVTMWNNQTGATNLGTYKGYMKDWVNRRLMVGMGEYDSKSYYAIDLAALSLLYTFAVDTTVKDMASDMLTYLYADMAVDSIESKLGGGQGRSSANKGASADQGIFYNNVTQYANDIMFDTSLARVDEFYANMNVQGAPFMVGAYRPPDVVLSIVRDQTKRFDNRERKTIYQIPDDVSITESLKKLTHVTPEYMLGSVVQEDEVPGLNAAYVTPSGTTWVPQGHQDLPWSLTFGKTKETVVFDSHPGPAGETDASSKHAYFIGSYGCFCSKLFQEENVLIGLHKIDEPNQLEFTHFWLIKDQFEQVDEEDGWIFLKQGAVYAAIKPLKNGTVSTSAQYTWTRSGRYAESEIKIHSANTAFIVEVVDTTEYAGSFSDFKTDIKTNPIVYSTSAPYYIEYTGLNGKELRLEFNTDVRKIDGVAVDFSTYKLHDSPYMTADWNDGTITIEYGASSEVIEVYP